MDNKNDFPGPCFLCKEPVPAKKGTLQRNHWNPPIAAASQRYVIRCKACNGKSTPHHDF